MPDADTTPRAILVAARARLQWLMAMRRAKRFRSDLLFSERQVFDAALRPRLDRGCIAYPDALWHVQRRDVDRAIAAVEAYRKERRAGHGDAFDAAIAAAGDA